MTLLVRNEWQKSARPKSTVRRSSTGTTYSAARLFGPANSVIRTIVRSPTAMGSSAAAVGKELTKTGTIRQRTPPLPNTGRPAWTGAHVESGAIAMGFQAGRACSSRLGTAGLPPQVPDMAGNATRGSTVWSERAFCSGGVMGQSSTSQAPRPCSGADLLILVRISREHIPDARRADAKALMRGCRGSPKFDTGS